ncbi:D-alanyl-D-alanine carboxypeptidase/D-alanyl-D-alanine endopeptidase [Laspinema olomoucense]|uniref:D-alanyl-D-alanine carboxypeptidase/D-alanyl-D-alanine endopeptidase n=1 Tax=Laspinema olomoucense TaxID=3231600 RepID=UPI0021BB91C3|nr:D-alanyl-D-alanine carboxypeptidase/D-alanyl-D-alanine-endopeptidase [Laspinema sp. D3c]MCT7995659.1 D-alanyl-D-alanine carboxypeptidase/D-alanyl-D-alanine-endopeptidase [Laspinema sp. D3c]
MLRLTRDRLYKSLKSLNLLALTLTLVSLPSPVKGQTAPPAPARFCQSLLEPTIAGIINRPELRRARWGILVETLEGGGDRTLYRRDSEQFFIPASNAKLLTSAAALHHLGPDFRIRTSVYGSNLTGDRIDSVRIVGRGDPTIGKTQLEAIAQQLQQQGIGQIGEIIGEDGYFIGSPVHPNWEWEDVQAGYGAPVNSLIFNQNSVDFTLTPQGLGQPLSLTWANPTEQTRWQVENRSRTVSTDAPEFLEVGRELTRPIVRVSGQLHVGSPAEEVSISVVEPAQNFLGYFRQALNGVGITTGREIVSDQFRNMPNQQELAAIVSPPLSEMTVEVLQKSNNLYTEVMLRSLGANPQGKGNNPLPEETREAGLQVLKAALTDLGVDPTSYDLVDASGLSRRNLVSPQSLVQTLRGMADSPYFDIYREALPLAGVSGTLRTRFRNTPAAQTVRAKTGTLTGVSALSGYVPNSEYNTLLFSIVVNQSDQSSAILRTAIDEIVVLLTRLERC